MEQKASIVGGYNTAVEQHEAILSAIEGHDVERAQSALRDHLESVGEKLTTFLLERESEKVLNSGTRRTTKETP